MERRDFLRFALGVAASAAVFGARTEAAPLAPHPLNDDAARALGKEAHPDAHPAVTTGDEVDHLKPEEVRWGHGRHRGWGRRHWGWHRRHWGWHRRHWGWRRRWHRRYWRRRYW